MCLTRGFGHKGFAAYQSHGLGDSNKQYVPVDISCALTISDKCGLFPYKMVVVKLDRKNLLWIFWFLALLHFKS